ncbi:MAG: nucleotide exchange factor GrpE [Candidatus Paceibacterota bacterium]|jgi:molecular chaperone GrpE
MNDDSDIKDTEIEIEDEGTPTSEEIEYADDNLSEVIKNLKAKIKVLESEKMDLLTSWQKDKAEFINARKRDEEAKVEFLKFAKQGVIEELLPALDSFDMAMGQKEKWESVSAEWRKGVENIQVQLLGTLSKHDVKPYGAVGDAFDPNLHHSIATVPAEEKSNDHKIAEVLQRGYMMSGKVVRPALVKVWEQDNGI